MIKSILVSTAIILTTATSALAGPAAAVGARLTPYGQFGCIQRAQNKLFAIGATNITSSPDSIWADLGDNSIGVWCRGSEAIVVTAGPDSSTLRKEVGSVF
jgi:hypothetical protein